MSRALVTGCAGFIGSHLCERLLADGWDVVGVDALTPYYDPSLKRENLEPLLERDHFRFDSRDLATGPDPTDLVAEADVVWHLAAQPGVRLSFGRGFTEYVNANVLATQRLLEASVGRELQRFVYASSSSVYGNAPAVPTREDSPLRPLSPYGMTKVATETLARTYHDVAGIPVVGLRYFTVYGPRQRPDMAFASFITAVLDGRPVTINGTGQQIRDFTFVEDIVRATVAAGEHGRAGHAYNVGGGHPVALIDVVRMLAGLLERPLNVEHRDAARGDARRTTADVSACGRDLGVVPGTALEDGLRRQVEWALSGSAQRRLAAA